MKTYYVLRNSITGLFFNGVNFTSEFEGAKFFSLKPNHSALRFIWGEEVEIVKITLTKME